MKLRQVSEYGGWLLFWNIVMFKSVRQLQNMSFVDATIEKYESTL